MIRFDGYYVFKPELYDNREGWIPDYYVLASLFLKNGKVLTKSKYTKDKNDIWFQKEDFEKDYGNNCYYVNDKEMYFIDKCEKDGFKFFYDIISDTEIRYRESGDIMKFVPWDNNEK